MEGFAGANNANAKGDFFVAFGATGTEGEAGGTREIKTARSVRMFEKLSLFTTDPSRAMMKMRSLNRGTYWRIPRRSVGLSE